MLDSLVRVSRRAGWVADRFATDPEPPVSGALPGDFAPPHAVGRHGCSSPVRSIRAWRAGDARFRRRTAVPRSPRQAGKRRGSYKSRRERDAPRDETHAQRPPSETAPSGCRGTDRGALPAESARASGRATGPGSSAFSSISRDGPREPTTGSRRVEFRGPTLRTHPFASGRFHVLLNSLFKVLFNFPSRYLSAIGLATVFSLRWSLPPALGCILKQPDSWDARSRRVPRR